MRILIFTQFALSLSAILGTCKFLKSVFKFGFEYQGSKCFRGSHFIASIVITRYVLTRNNTYKSHNTYIEHESLFLSFETFSCTISFTSYLFLFSLSLSLLLCARIILKQNLYSLLLIKVQSYAAIRTLDTIRLRRRRNTVDVPREQRKRISSGTYTT